MEDTPPWPPASTAASVPEPAPDNKNESYDYRDLIPISSKLRVLLLIGIGANALVIASSVMQLNLLSRAPYTVEEGSANDLRQSCVSIADLLLYVATVVVFGRWIYLAHRNLPALGARYLKFRPGWAVGSFFVPIVCLWAPYQAMRDLAKASRSPHQWELEDTPFVLVISWALWLIVQLLANASFRAELKTPAVIDLYNITWIDLISHALAIPLYLLALYIVYRVARDQSLARYADSEGA